MEVEDILKRRLHHTKLDLTQAACAVSGKSRIALERDFLKGIPFAYLLQKAEFYHHTFHVNSHVLIPRPETEELVDMIIGESKKVKRPFSSVLDVGTGSGVILLSLLSADAAMTGLGVDLSPDALKVAETNARRLRLLPRCALKKSDRLNEVDDVFELIVSNPPYIKAQVHRNLVHQQVDQHEPHMALFLDDQEYHSWFQSFFTQVKKHLKPDGLFMMEGHELELDEQAKLLLELGFTNVSVLNDLAGAKRFLKAKN